MVKFNFSNIIKRQFLLPAAVAVIIAAVFAVAYFNSHKAPSGVSGIEDRQDPGSESPTSTDNQGNIGVTEGDYMDSAPESETVREAGSNVSYPATAPSSAKSGTIAPSKIDPEGVSIRDGQRQTDMRRLAAAQASWYGDHKKYYTCGAAGGDCHGKVNSLPSSIGSAGNDAVDPVNSGRICGRDYTYCGLDNTRNSTEFCYYAKLEAGGYYGVSRLGSFKSAAPPSSLADCSIAPLAAKPEPETPQQTTPQERDARRQIDMSQLSAAQAKWLSFKGRYYTCAADGGDCQGKIANYPAAIGSFMAKTPVDPLNSGGVCGGGYIYCGLDNSRTPTKFCYFAKLETGGYYAVSNSGSFKRSTPPATFGECGQPN